jgi:hypothetical protein
MQAIWFKNVKTEEDKAKRKAEVLNYRNAFDDLRALLSSMYPEFTIPDYDNPSWSHKQAHYNGEREAIRKVINLINLEG